MTSFNRCDPQMKNRLSSRRRLPWRCIDQLQMDAVTSASRVMPERIWRIALFLASMTALTDAGMAVAMTPPPWVQGQVSVPTPEHDDTADAVLLYSEAILTA